MTSPPVPDTPSSAPRPLLIVGAGGFARETVEAVRAANRERQRWELRGFLDDDPERRGEIVAGLPILGPVELVHEQADAAVTIATGRTDNYVSRRLIAERLELGEERYATIVHPTASVGESCRLGPGTVLLAHTAVTADVVLGSHVAVMPQVVIPHDVRVDDFVTIASGVRVGGGCQLGEGAYIGSGACLLQGTAIGPWAMVGMGAVLTRDVPGERQWWGAPARDKGRAPLPHDRAPAPR